MLLVFEVRACGPAPGRAGLLSTGELKRSCCYSGQPLTQTAPLPLLRSEIDSQDASKSPENARRVSRTGGTQRWSQNTGRLFGNPCLSAEFAHLGRRGKESHSLRHVDPLAGKFTVTTTV